MDSRIQVTTEQLITIRCAAIQAASRYVDGKVEGTRALLEVAEEIERHLLKRRAI